MKSGGKQRFLGMAASLAILLHLLLFLAVRPSGGHGLVSAPKPPETHYLSSGSALGDDARITGSPVLFSLPSRLGFSHALLHAGLRTRLTLKQRKEADAFLEIDPAPPEAAPEKLMLTAGGNSAPELPETAVQPLKKQPSAQRIHISPGLKERLVDGIVLPPELNRETATAWQVQAEVGISSRGEVLHVFLDRPLEPEALNQQVLQLLHGLRFKPGDAPAEGRIELYSPETARKPAEGAAP